MLTIEKTARERMMEDSAFRMQVLSAVHLAMENVYNTIPKEYHQACADIVSDAVVKALQRAFQTDGEISRLTIENELLKAQLKNALVAYPHAMLIPSELVGQTTK